MKYFLSEIINITNAELIYGEDTCKSYSISTDTRTITNDDIYLPLIGEKFDGHNFISMAINKGIDGYFTSDRNLINENAQFVLYVEDTKKAYLQCALYYKNKIKPITVAITGSSGKTTTKEMMSAVLEQKYITHKSKLNHNNEVGLAQTLLSMPEDCEALVVEMGMRGLGEIELLSKYSEPDIAIIVNSGSAHLGRLGSLDNISIAKNEISKYLDKNGLLVAHDSDIIKKHNHFTGKTVYFSLNSEKLKITEQKQNGSEFIYKDNNYILNVEGEYNIQNALAVIEVAEYLKMSSEEIKTGLMSYTPIEKRWEVQNIANFKIINDSYNANPESMKVAIKTFLELYQGELLLVLGGMEELGENSEIYHKEIGEFLNKFNNFKLITVGNLAKIISENTKQNSIHFDTINGVAEYIKKAINSSTTIFFKASRVYEFEKIIEELKID